MSWYSGASSLGTCHACGSPVSDGGQSGAYCSNSQCPNSYFGGKTREQLDGEADERRRKLREDHQGWWSVWCKDDKPYPSGAGSGLVPTREAAVAFATRERARGLMIVQAMQVVGDDLVDVDDDLTP